MKFGFLYFFCLAKIISSLGLVLLQMIFNPNLGVPDRSSGQSLIKRNCHNSRTSDDIDMKLGQVTKLDKRNKTTSKNDHDAMLTNCDALPLSQFRAIRKPDSGRIVCKTYILIKRNLLSYKNLKQLKNF